MSPFKRVLLALATLAVIACTGLWLIQPGPEEKSRSLLQQAVRHSVQGNLQQAESDARAALQLNPGLSAASILAAEGAIARQDFDVAIEDLSQVTDSETDEWITARRMAADVYHHHLFRFRDAEVAYRDVLSKAEGDVKANDGYARLLGLCGRRGDAIPHVLQLIQAGEETDLLMLLARESGALNDPDMIAAASSADPRDPNVYLARAQVAASNEQSPLALQHLMKAKELSPLPDCFHGKLGRQLVANGRFDDLRSWATQTQDIDGDADVWLSRAGIAEHMQDRAAMIRCYWEALKYRPESLQATYQLATLLKQEKRQTEANVFSARAKQLDEFRALQQQAIMSDQQPGFDELFAMMQGYRSVGRIWETHAWGSIALQIDAQNPQLVAFMQSLPSVQNLPLQLTVDESNPTRQVDLSEYPLPDWSKMSGTKATSATSTNVSFTQQRDEIGFDFEYFNGSPASAPTNRMFEFSGGGIAVIDFDNDHWPDIFCSQGRSYDAAGDDNSQPIDCLYRNQNGQSFVDVTLHTGMTDVGFGQGVSAGDFNNDGFTDLYVAQTGRNSLWMNNGDGTFSDASDQIVSRNQEWTTSCLIADLNGDSIPDLYDVNYLAGPNVFTRLCIEENGDKIMCSPYDFEPAVDRVWLGDGEGGFADQTDTLLSESPAGKGLGIAAFRTGVDVGEGAAASDGAGLSLFIANDTTANFFYTPAVENGKLTNTAVTSGLAFNAEGKAEACMGIAVGDCTQDGRLDLFVTNFLFESNTLYSPLDAEFFEDKTRQLGLHEPTLPVLGFGTQFLDANLDGRYELFVANGYTQDMSKYGTPYEMKPHVFEWTGSQFQKLPVKQLGGWSDKKSVGRAVARLDWNGDRKPDLVVGLLNAKSYVLTNTSDVNADRSLSLRFVATTSSRDAIGTTVTVEWAGSKAVHQLTAGDGYQCTNQRTITIATGDSTTIDRITVTWPSGETQVLSDVATDQSLIVIQGVGVRPVVTQ